MPNRLTGPPSLRGTANPTDRPMLPAHSSCARSRMAALCNNLCVTAQAFSGVRISGASTCWWLMDLR